MEKLKAMIRIQWKGSWHLVLALTVAALALPIVSVRSGLKGAAANLPLFLTELQLWGFFYPTLAAIAAIVIAVSIWRSDRRGHHIYALLLPIPRWRYVLLRYVAGLILLAPIVLGLWAGAIVATLALDLPPGLRSFPHALAIKFALSLLLLFGLAFAAASASSRALGIGFKMLGVFLAVHLAVIMLRPGTNLIWMVVRALASYPGPFAPMGGRWMLIDV
jgi:ABC-type transport system involved in multi-copper enzyme maturation permease subunit